VSFDRHAITGLDRDEIASRILPKIEQSLAREAEGRSPLRYVSVGGVLSDSQHADAIELHYPGVHIESRSVREYAAGDLVASLLGKVGVDHDGLLGVELSQDEALSPSVGTLSYTRDARGNALWVNAGAFRGSSKGNDVHLSIDLVLQEIARDELIKGVERADAAGGRLVMVDPATGEILAMVDHVREIEGLEPFDLKNPPSREETSGVGRRFRAIPEARENEHIHPALRRNRCIEDLYEPGSTFKPFIWSVITERGLAQAHEKIDTHKGLWKTSYGRRLRDVSPMDSLTWSDVLVHSSNIGMASVAERLSYKDTRRDIQRFGFGVRTGVGLAGESAGMLTSEKNWSKYTQTSIAMGYEIGVTPVQMVRAFCAFARSDDDAGTVPMLRLTNESQRSDSTGVRYRALEPWVVYLARASMERVADAMIKRYGSKGEGDPTLTYAIFGKSGTAEIVRPDGKGYLKGQHNSSFLAAAPAEEPKIVILVVIDDPGPERVTSRTHYGSAVAGPVVCNVVQRTLEYMGVPSASARDTFASAE